MLLSCSDKAQGVLLLSALCSLDHLWFLEAYGIYHAFFPFSVHSGDSSAMARSVVSCLLKLPCVQLRMLSFPELISAQKQEIFTAM